MSFPQTTIIGLATSDNPNKSFADRNKQFEDDLEVLRSKTKAAHENWKLASNKHIAVLEQITSVAPSNTKGELEALTDKYKQLGDKVSALLKQFGDAMSEEHKELERYNKAFRDRYGLGPRPAE